MLGRVGAGTVGRAHPLVRDISYSDPLAGWICENVPPHCDSFHFFKETGAQFLCEILDFKMWALNFNIKH